MSDARQRILRRIAHALERRWPVELPGDPWRQAEDAAAPTRFVQNATQNGVEALSFDSPQAAARWLAEWAAEFSSAAVSPHVPPWLQPQLPQRPPAEAELGVSRALAAVADTGSVLLSSSEGRRLQLLPPVHLVWVDEAEVVQHLGEALEALQENPPSALALHSGPSKSADIGQIMVQGVHGPGRLVVALVRGLDAAPKATRGKARGKTTRATPSSGLDWNAVRRLQGRTLATKTGKAFEVLRVTDNTVVIRVGSSEKSYTLRRKTLEKAAALARGGAVIQGPSDFKKKVADEAPAYAWAILRELGAI